MIRSRRPLLFVSALLLTGWSALAQSSPDKGKWSGRASLTAGYGWSMPDGESGEIDTLQRFHQSAEVVARYETRKFSVSTRLSQLQDRNETERIKMVYKTTKEGDEVSQLDLILRASNPRQKRYEARTDFRWRPSDRSTFSWYVGYVDLHNVTVNTMGQFQLIADREETSVEDTDGRQRMSLSGFRGNVQLAGRQVILGGFDWNREWNWRQTHWERIGATFEDLRRAYRLTPFFIRDRSTAFFTYRDSTMFGVPRLRFEAGGLMTLNRDNDRYGGATLRANGSWQDSLRAKEHFDFIAAQLDYRQRNMEELRWFQPSVAVGGAYKVFIDGNSGKFAVASEREMREGNPDLFDLAGLRSCSFFAREHIIKGDENESDRFDYESFLKKR